jgi:diaminohydroxyphosphoribosylaminopyrimidine deaminase/5-amino-6-(5-phosphoribosylamino)uracil reductase
MRRPEEFMRRALKLAERGAGWTSPNPLVGAVVVKKNIILGEGWHAEFGGPHAEFFALQRAGTLARGADLYVTLEPCVAALLKHNPPCADAIIRAGIQRVFIALRDPDPRVNGGASPAYARRASTLSRDSWSERPASSTRSI